MFNIQPSGIYFYTVIIAFMGGVIFRSFADLGLWLGLLLLVIGGAIAAMSFALMGGKNVVLIALVVVAVGVGVTRLEVADKKEFVLQEWVGQKISLSAAVVVNEPDVRDKHQQLTVLSDGLLGRILVLTELFPQYRYGDKISIQGRLEEPASFEVNTGRVFDYPAYLAKDGIYFQMFYPQIELVSHGEGGSAIKRALYGLKNAFMDNIRLVIPEPHASLLGGLLLGIKRSLGAELLDDFRAVGLIHIVVLSGYNITIIADFIGRLLASLRSLRARLALSAIAIVLFVILTGGSATIVRAGVMALLVLLARVTRRRYDIMRALAVAGGIMILFNPRILAFDPSFQLSFLATFSLITLAPLVESRLQWLSTRFKLRETATTTISTQIFVLPLILYMTGELSLVALPVNLLVLMIIPATMLLGFLAGALSFLHVLVALPVAWAGYFLLEYQLRVVDIFSSLSTVSLNIGLFPFWAVLVGYGILGAVILYFKKMTPP